MFFFPLSLNQSVYENVYQGDIKNISPVDTVDGN